MTTSGQTGYLLTTNDIINEAFDICGIAVEGEDLTPAEYDRALRSLNLMMRKWQSKGINLWTYNEGTIFLKKGQSAYNLNEITVAPWSNPTGTFGMDTGSFAMTQLTNDVLAGTINFAVEQNELLTWKGVLETLSDEDNIGFLLSDNTIFWTWVDGNMGEIAAPFPEDLPAGTLVFWGGDYARSAMQPVERVLDVRRLDANTSGNLNEVPVQFEAHKDFFSLPNRTSQGVVDEATFQRMNPGGVIHVWQVPTSETQLLRITYERKIQNFVNSDDDPDIPDHFMNAVVWNLAEYLAKKFNVSLEDQQIIKQTAYEELQEALSFDDANYDIKVTLNRNSRS